MARLNWHFISQSILVDIVPTYLGVCTRKYKSSANDPNSLNVVYTTRISRDWIDSLCDAKLPNTTYY